MSFTCRCGWHGQVPVQAALVARAGELRSRHIGVRNRRVIRRKRRQLTQWAVMLVVAGLVCFGLGALEQTAVVWLWSLGGALAIGAMLLLAVRSFGRPEPKRR